MQNYEPHLQVVHSDYSVHDSSEIFNLCGRIIIEVGRLDAFNYK